MLTTSFGPFFRFLSQSVAFAWRLAARQPAQSAVAVLTLGLGIGATAALFSVVNAWLLRPLPFHDPDRLVVVWETVPSQGITQNTPAPASFAAWEQQAASFALLAPWTLMTTNLSGSGEPARLQAIVASPQLLPLLGRGPAMGRNFSTDEARGAGGDVALVSHAFWQARLSGTPDVLGRRITLDGRPIEVIDVLPDNLPLLGFAYDVWRPLVLDPASESRMLWVFGRLRPGATINQASREVAAIGESRAGNPAPARVVPLHEQTVGPIGRDVMVLFAATGFVLLIACANVANLTLARLSARRQEFLMRAALGSSRTRIAGQVLIESLVLGMVGAIAGVIFAAWLVPAVVSLAPFAERLAAVRVADLRVLGFISAAAIATAMLFGLVPAWQAASGDLAAEVRAGARGLVPGRRRLLGGLVMAEMALALALLTSAGLVLRSFVRLSGTDLGFRADGLLVFDLPRAQIGGREQRNAAFYASLAERLSASSGVSGVALSQALPLRSVGSMGGGFVVEGRIGDEATVPAFWRVVNGEFFGTMQIPLLSGRFFDRRESERSTPVAIVSESFARRAWPDGNAIGRRVGWGTFENPLTVVGVAADIRHSPAAEPWPHVYMPFTQVPAWPPGQVAVRADSGTAATVDLVRRVVHDLDPDQPIAAIATGEQLLAQTMGRRRFQLTLVSAFAVAAGVLALVGIYCVLSFVTGQLMCEMGIRLALGATPAQVRWAVLRHGLGLALSGAVAGVLLSTWSSRLLTGFLVGIERDDLPTYAAASALLIAAAAATSLLPARRAARVDPVIALRAE